MRVGARQYNQIIAGRPLVCKIICQDLPEKQRFLEKSWLLAA